MLQRMLLPEICPSFWRFFMFFVLANGDHWNLTKNARRCSIKWQHVLDDLLLVLWRLCCHSYKTRREEWVVMQPTWNTLWEQLYLSDQSALTDAPLWRIPLWKPKIIRCRPLHERNALSILQFKQCKHISYSCIGELHGSYHNMHTLSSPLSRDSTILLLQYPTFFAVGLALPIRVRYPAWHFHTSKHMMIFCAKPHSATCCAIVARHPIKANTKELRDNIGTSFARYKRYHRWPSKLVTSACSTETDRELKRSKMNSKWLLQTNLKVTQSDSKVTQDPMLESSLSQFWLTLSESLWSGTSGVTFESLLGHLKNYLSRPTSISNTPTS